MNGRNRCSTGKEFTWLRVHGHIHEESGTGAKGAAIMTEGSSAPGLADRVPTISIAYQHTVTFPPSRHARPGQWAECIH